jgi:hypothetical protein
VPKNIRSREAATTVSTLAVAASRLRVFSVFKAAGLHPQLCNIADSPLF